LQIKIRESFDCPSCHSQVSVSDGYRQAMRWVGLCAYLTLAPFTILLLEHDVSATLGILLLWPIVFGAGTSGLLLFQKNISASAAIRRRHIHHTESRAPSDGRDR